ncbi:flagellar hook-length control protein FliK, partial [Modestobacter versicolor]
TGTGTPAATVPGTAPVTAATPVLPGLLPETPVVAVTPQQASPAPAVTAAATALADAAGLTLVLDPASAPAVPAAPATPATGPVAGVPLLLPAAVPADASGAGADGSADGAPLSAPAATEVPAAADTDSVFTLAGPAPAAPGAPVTAAAAAAPAGGEPAVAEQLGRQIAVLRNAPDGSQTMTVVLRPESLGEVTVAVTVTDGKLDLVLHGAQEAGRHALREALPELRRDLEAAGLSFDKLEVDTSTRDGGPGSRTAQQ